MKKVYVNTIGVKIVLDAGSDLSTATLAKIKFQCPDKTTGEWVGTVEGSTVWYITRSGDLSLIGRWKLQIYVVLPDLYTGPGETTYIDVLAAFG